MFWSMVRIELFKRGLQEPSLLFCFLLPIDIRLPLALHLFQHGILYAIKDRRDLCQLILLRPNISVEETWFHLSVDTLVLFQMCHIFSKVYLDRLFTSHADSFEESSIVNKLALTETITEYFLSEFDKALATINCCWLPPRFNVLAISFLN